MLDTIDPAAKNGAVEGLTADQAVQLIRELCARLAGQDFHGNIWPGSVSVDENGAAVLGEGSDTPVSGRTAAQVEYLSPEYFWDNEGTPASDVYSLGLMLYAGCNDGYLPFQPKGGALTDKDRSGALRKRMKGESIPLPAGISEGLATVLTQALAYEPEERYASPAALLAALGATDEALPAAAAAEPAPEEVWLHEEAPDNAPTEILEEPAPAAPAAEPAEPAKAAAPQKVAQKSGKKNRKKNARNNAPKAEAPKAPEPKAEEPAAAIEPKAEPVKAPAEERKYTVQKDFEKDRSKKAASAAPASRKKKKKKGSALVPILCIVAAAALLAGGWYVLNHKAPRTSPTLDLEEEAEPVVVLPAEGPAATEPPAPAEDVHTLQMTDLMEDEAESADTEAPAAAEPEVTGSATVDGMDVTAAGGPVYVAGSGVNLRTGPGTSYEVAKTLPRGTKLQRTGTVNGWTQVQYEGAEYYVSSSLIDETDPTGQDTETVEDTAHPAESAPSDVSAAEDTVTVTGEVVNLRSGPSTGSEIVTTVKAGTQLKRTGTVNGWSRVEYQGKELYISDSMIRSGSGASAAGTTTLKVTSDVNVRANPNTGAEILSVAKVGETLTSTGTSADGKWYKVTRDGKEGYVNRKLVTVVETAPADSGAAVTAGESGKVTVVSDVNVRAGAGTGYDILGAAKAGETLTTTGKREGNWIQVEYQGKTGYVSANFVK